jgi:hypothetical protein
MSYEDEYGVDEEVAVMVGVREYVEQDPVRLLRRSPKAPRGVGRLVISAENEGGYNGTEIDLLDLIEWLNKTYGEAWSRDPATVVK